MTCPFLVAILVFSAVFSIANSQMVRPDQIAHNVYLNDTTFVAYNISTSKCRIDCADSDTMADPNFRSWQKVWMFNGTELFSPNDKTFIDSNRSLEFQVLSAEDAGPYECCVRGTDLAYQSFVCYTTQLIVVSELPSEELNATQEPLPPSWNVVVEDGDTLNCAPASNYFVKVFELNVTDIKCLVNMVEANIKTSNNFAPPLYNDLLIEGFNMTEHSGVYVCNGTIQIGNETVSEMTSFTVSESLDQNKNADLLEDKDVRAALNTTVGPSKSIELIMAMILMTVAIII